MTPPLSRFAPSPSLAVREGDNSLAAGRPLLAVSMLDAGTNWDGVPLSRFAASPSLAAREGDNAFAAGLLSLGVFEMEYALLAGAGA